jgi:hypothetical protein
MPCEKIMKIGNLELEDWKTISDSFCCRMRVGGNVGYRILIGIGTSNDSHTVLFWEEMRHLNSVFKYIHDLGIIEGTLQQAKEETDKFLIKISKMRAFT